MTVALSPFAPRKLRCFRVVARFLDRATKVTEGFLSGCAGAGDPAQPRSCAAFAERKATFASAPIRIFMSERANDPYAVWRQANFRLYCVGWFLLVFGKMIETVAVGVHVYDRTDDYLSLGWVGLCQAFPSCCWRSPEARSPIVSIAAA